MIPYLRQMQIIKLLNSTDIVSIGDLQEHLPGVSISTIRRDMKSLVKDGTAIELQGGALKLKDMAYDTPVNIKEHLYNKEKTRIAQQAAQLVHDGETIYIDSGTTLTYMFPLLLKKNITLATTNTDVYKYLTAQKSEVRIIQIGGEFNFNLRSLAGPITNIQLEMLHFDKAFLGASGFDAEAGITTPDFQEMAKKQIIKRKSKQTYFLLDSSKCDQVYVSQICSIDESQIVSNKYTPVLALCKEYIIAEK